MTKRPCCEKRFFDFELIEDYVKDTIEKKYLSNQQQQDAVIRRIEIIGEMNRSNICVVDRILVLSWWKVWPRKRDQHSDFFTFARRS
jgi:hypothetical protein